MLSTLPGCQRWRINNGRKLAISNSWQPGVSAAAPESASLAAKRGLSGAIETAALSLAAAG